MSDFTDFQKTFKVYQKLFGLNGYQVYFKYEPISDAFADIAVIQDNMVATVRLDNKKDSQRHVKQSAKHEAIHLLLNRLEYYGRCRYVQPEEINEAVEELVVRLQGLIPDLKK